MKTLKESINEALFSKFKKANQKQNDPSIAVIFHKENDISVEVANQVANIISKTTKLKLRETTGFFNGEYSDEYIFDLSNINNINIDDLSNEIFKEIKKLKFNKLNVSFIEETSNYKEIELEFIDNHNAYYVYITIQF